jgi:DNA-binding transcriptional regulator YiaG
MSDEMAETIRAVRLDLGMTHKTFASAMTMSIRTSYRWQSGKIRMNKGWQRAKLLNLTAKLGTPAVAQLRNIFARDGIIAMERKS